VVPQAHMAIGNCLYLWLEHLGLSSLHLLVQGSMLQAFVVEGSMVECSVLQWFVVEGFVLQGYHHYLHMQKFQFSPLHN